MPHNTAVPVTTTGDLRIDSLLMGARWAETVVTYSFPQTSSAYAADYPSTWPQQNFQPFSANWAAHAVSLLAEVSSFTLLTFTQDSDAASGSLRWGRFDDQYNGAYAYGPGSNEYGGDQWFANNANADPVRGEAVSHIMRHELGHALGLSHPFEGIGGAAPASYDSLEYSTMSYRLHTSQQDGDYSGNHYEQSFMSLDIAALQYLYGANYAFNATDTTYSFDPATGRMLVNGVLGDPMSHVVVLRTIWDGGGVDTYDFSNFTDDQRIDLAPGAWSTFDESMLAVPLQRQATPGGPLTPVPAAGNITNALLYQDDLRSLIENAIGGTGDDWISGNQADNVLNGGAGDDELLGLSGNDILIGGSGSDTLIGGDGYDIAVYAGARGGYATATYSGVTGGVEGGTDNISGVEALAFVDGQLTFHRDGIAAQVMRLYDSAFNRIPDAGGFEAQLDAMEGGMSLNTLAQLFVESIEFQNTYGALTNRQFVEQLYRNVLDREGDEAGIQNALNAITGGQTRGQLLVAFSESVEHMNLTQGTLDQGLWIADDQTLIIARLYDAAWNRLPDEGGLITWRNALGGGTNLQAIADAFAGATEFTNTYGTLTDRQFVEQLYRNVLDREGDEGGINNALNAIAGGQSRGQIMLAFSESVEHISLTRSLWIGGVSLYGAAAAPVEAKGTDEPLTLPGADEFVLLPDKSDDGALVLPGVDDAFTFLKEADQALVLPGLDDGWTSVVSDHFAFGHGLDRLDDNFIGLRTEDWAS